MSTARELEFLGTLGKGGFGSVYLANLHGRDQFVRRVAVKVLRHAGEGDAGLVARQRDEARLLGLLSHEGIVQVLDLTEIEGRPAVIMEYIEGADVAEIARMLRSRSAAFPARAAFEIVAAAAGALDVAWSSASPLTGTPLNVVHRDIKPANLVVALRGGVKVLDFGIARAEFGREGVTQSGFFGTPAYMAPEFWVQEPIGSAYDIYALGVSLLELLSGQAPERAPMERARLDAFMDTRIRPLGLPPAADALLRGMVAFQAQDRPTAADVQERASELAPTLPGDSVARLARSVVPGIVEVRSRTMDTSELPSRTSLGIVSGPATGPGAGEALATARGIKGPPKPAPPAGPEGGGKLLVGAVAAAVAAGLISVGLAALAWVGWPAGAPGPELAQPVATTAPDPAAPDRAAPGAAAPGPVAVDPGSAVDASSAELPPATSPPVVDPSRPPASPVTRKPSGPAAAVRIESSQPSPTAAASTSTSPSASPSTAPPSPAPSTQPAPTVAAAAPPPAPASSAPVARRALSFGCTQAGASLEIDGAASGATPRAGVQVSDGQHVIVASLGDRACRRTITVGAEQPSGYVCDMATQTWSAKL